MVFLMKALRFMRSIRIGLEQKGYLLLYVQITFNIGSGNHCVVYPLKREPEMLPVRGVPFQAGAIDPPSLVIAARSYDVRPIVVHPLLAELRSKLTI